MKTIRQLVLGALVLAVCAPVTRLGVASELTYRMKKIEEASDATFTLSYPQFVYEPSKKVEDTINHYIQEIILSAPTFFEDCPAASIEKMIKRYMKQNKGEKSFYREIDISVQSQVEGAVCVRARLSFFSGGAHDQTFTRFSNFNLRTGEKIQLSEVFIKGYEKELTKIAEAQFRREREIPENDLLSDYGYQFENDKFHLKDNFCITNKGVIFYYNNYDITPFVEGSAELLLEYEDIEHLLKKPARNYMDRARGGNAQ